MTAAQIIDEEATKAGIESAAIVARNRSRSMTVIRQEVIRRLRVELNLTQVAIGKLLQRHHTDIGYVCLKLGLPAVKKTGRTIEQIRAGWKLQKKRQYADHIAKGLCKRCTEPATRKTNGKLSRLCLKHGQQNAAKVSEYRDEVDVLKSPAGVCVECGTNPPMRDQAICWCCANPPAPRAEKEAHARTHVAQR